MNLLCDNSSTVTCTSSVMYKYTRYSVECIHWWCSLQTKTSFSALLLRNDCKSTAGHLLFSHHSLMLDYPPALYYPHLSTQYIHNIQDGLNSMLVTVSISILCFISSFYSVGFLKCMKQNLKLVLFAASQKRHCNVTVMKQSVAQ